MDAAEEDYDDDEEEDYEDDIEEDFDLLSENDDTNSSEYIEGEENTMGG